MTSLRGSAVGSVRHLDGRYPYNAGAKIEPGDVVVRPDGTLAIYDGLNGAANGERIDPQPLHPTLICEFAAKSTDTWSAGAILYWDVADKQVNASASDNIYVGRSVTAKTNGMTSILVNCVPHLGIDTTD